MTKRRYKQYCPIAYGLDLIGERWTLLIVRELLEGPKRFTDLLQALPGSGSNLLSQRLKDLEQADLIRRETLPPPAASTVYTLTDLGAELKNVVEALSTFGQKLLPFPPPAEDFYGTSSAIGGIRALFKPVRAQGVETRGEFHSEQGIFHVAVQDGQVQVNLGKTAQPAFKVKGDLKDLAQLFADHVQPKDAIAQKLIVLEEGDRVALERFFDLFGLA